MDNLSQGDNANPTVIPEGAAFELCYYNSHMDGESYNPIG